MTPLTLHVYRRHLLAGLVFAALIHLAAVGSFQGASLFHREDFRKPWVYEMPVELTQIAPERPPLNLAPIVVRPHAPRFSEPAQPIPIPDPVVTPEPADAPVVADQAPPGPVEVSGEPGGGRSEPGATQSPATGVLDVKDTQFVWCDKYPEPVITVIPEYPSLARAAGLEGKVVVRVRIGIDGRVEKAHIVSSDADIFNQAALDAALRWVFTPGIQGNQPIAVWETIPFRFRLEN